jgi:hypothetical protein
MNPKAATANLNRRNKRPERRVWRQDAALASQLPVLVIKQQNAAREDRQPPRLDQE